MHGILPCDQYNFDKTGFSIGVGGQQYVVTMDLAKKCAESPSDSNRDHVSLVETVSADGSVLPPLCIMKGAVVLFQHVSNYLNLDPNMLLATSESGYSNDQIALSFIRHFDKFSALRQKGAWRLLIFDGHGSHLTYKFITYCWDNKIIPFGLPSHTSHILQPLDVVIFQPLKHYHKQQVEVATRLGCDDFNKVEFLNAIQLIRRKTFTETTIKASFREAGLYPLNPDLVLSKLKTVDRPSTPSTIESMFAQSPPTPFTPKSIDFFARNFIQGINLENGEMKVRLDRVTKLARCGIANAAARLAAEHELKVVNAATNARKRRQKSDRRQIGNIGPVYISDARLTVAKRNEKEDQKRQKAAKRAAEVVAKSQ